MTTRPLRLVSKSVRALLDQVWQGPLGQLFTPRMLTGLDITEGCSIQWAADNDCFAGFQERRYLDMLEAITYRSGCLFVVAPDVVADARATLRLFDQWEPALRCVWATVNEDDVEPGQLVHQPIAFVAQDGQERLPVPWEHFQALFVGVISGLAGQQLSDQCGCVVSGVFDVRRWACCGATPGGQGRYRIDAVESWPWWRCVAASGLRRVRRGASRSLFEPRG